MLKKAYERIIHEVTLQNLTIYINFTESKEYMTLFMEFQKREEDASPRGVMGNPGVRGTRPFCCGYLIFGVIRRFTHPREVARCIE